jgi:ABC-type branched-subunit amino acid transport system substrate-binding protein
VLRDGSPSFQREIVDPFVRTARRRGVGIAGSSRFNPDSVKGYDALARRVKRSRPDGVLYASGPFPPAIELLKAVRKRLGPRVPVMVSGEFDSHGTRDLFAAAGPAVRGVYVPTLGLPRSAVPMTAAARHAARTIDATQSGVLEAAQATEIVLDAIAHSDGTRASVLAELRGADVTDGILGTFRFDDNGDMTPGWVAILRITRPADSMARDLEGAALVGVERPPPSAGE